MSDQNSMEIILDQLIDGACRIASEKIGRQFSEPEQHEFSKEHQKAIQALFQQERNKLLHKKIIRWTRKVAIVLLVFISISTIAIFSVQAWRIRFLNFVLETRPRFTDITFTDKKGDTYATDDVTLGYIPEGFSLEKSELSDQRIRLSFTNNQKHFILYVYKNKGSMSLDTANAQIKKLQINGSEATFSYKPTVSFLLWTNNDYLNLLESNLEEKEMVKIADNLKNSKN